MQGLEKRWLAKRGEKTIVDFHVHVGPEFLARRYDALSIAREAHASGFGCVLKNHFTPTTALAAQARAHRPVTVLGSVVLNYSVGGLNPHAIHAAQSANKASTLEPTPDPLPFVVWMPTIHAEGHLVHTGRRDLVPSWGVDGRYCHTFPPGAGITIWGPGGPGRGLRPEVHEILELVLKYDLILATGHLSAAEVKALVAAAHDRGLRKVIVTHPFFGATGLSLREQASLAERDGVYLEHCYSNLQMDGIPLEHYVASIREVTPGRVILSSDVGQPHTPSVTRALGEFCRMLLAEGITEEDILTMLRDNPHRLLSPGSPGARQGLSEKASDRAPGSQRS